SWSTRTPRKSCTSTITTSTWLARSTQAPRPTSDSVDRSNRSPRQARQRVHRAWLAVFLGSLGGGNQLDGDVVDECLTDSRQGKGDRELTIARDRAIQGELTPIGRMSHAFCEC